MNFCGKICYPDQKSASLNVRRLRKMNKRCHKLPKDESIYYCKSCKAYHTSKMSKETAKRIKRQLRELDEELSR